MQSDVARVHALTVPLTPLLKPLLFDQESHDSPNQPTPEFPANLHANLDHSDKQPALRMWSGPPQVSQAV